MTGNRRKKEKIMFFLPTKIKLLVLKEFVKVRLEFVSFWHRYRTKLTMLHVVFPVYALLSKFNPFSSQLKKVILALCSRKDHENLAAY